MLDSGDILLLGEMFGRIRYVAPDETLPDKVHAIVIFDDGGRLVVTIQAWGGFQVLTPEELAAHPYAGALGVSPLDDAFTSERFAEILDGSGDWSRKPIKAFLVHERNIAGVGNGYLQDILFRAKLSPKRKVPDLGASERRRLHAAIVETMAEAVRLGGRDTEKDLLGKPGGYVPLLDRRTNGTACPECGTTIEKIQYLGGSCYVCPSCQT
ncbi:endonuclease VIII [Candidatus Bipolaricaulota bacterium]|nr:endonuclease VIII [Candidatus Bipolaricaulota bacterium]